MNNECPRTSSLGAGLSLRAEAPGDESLLFELYASAREEELALTGWDIATRTAFLNMQFAAMRRGYRDMFPQGQFSILLADGVPVGRMVLDRSTEELHLVDIVLLPAHRNRGIGTAVMKALIEEAEQSRKPISLQVLKNSRAVGFYRRLGFSKNADSGLYDNMEWRGVNCA